MKQAISYAVSIAFMACPAAAQESASKDLLSAPVVTGTLTAGAKTFKLRLGEGQAQVPVDVWAVVKRSGGDLKLFERGLTSDKEGYVVVTLPDPLLGGQTVSAWFTKTGDCKTKCESAPSQEVRVRPLCAAPMIVDGLRDGSTSLVLGVFGTAKDKVGIEIFANGQLLMAKDPVKPINGRVTVDLDAHKPLQVDTEIQVRQIVVDQCESDLSEVQKVPASVDLGRFHADFWGGVILSRPKVGEGFSDKDGYFSVVATNNLAGFNCDPVTKLKRRSKKADDPCTLGWFNSEIEARLSSAATTTTGNVNVSKATALLRGTLTYDWSIGSWADGERRFVFGPLGWLDFSTSVEDQPSSSDVNVEWVLGARVGLIEGKPSSHRVGELVSFFSCGYSQSQRFSGDRSKQNRFVAETRLQLPHLPIIIGADINIGKGRDDVRFIFGTRFDIAKVFSKLGGSSGGS